MSLNAAFESHRELLFRLSYRMTGSTADAEDIVQDTFARALERPPIEDDRDLKPWLVQVALNLGRDHLRRRKRLGYTGPWLPAPLETEGADDATPSHPEARYGELESVSHAFLVALEALTPAQRACVILRDVLGHSVSEAATLLRVSESNLKTMHHRARAKLSEYDAQRVPLTRELQGRTREALVKLFMSLLAGDVASLESMLAQDVMAINDGNGEYFAARVPLLGRERVIKFHIKVGAKRGSPAFAIRQINGLPAVVCEFFRHVDGMAPRAVIALVLDRQGHVRWLNTTVASGKLSRLRFDI
ncbi:MAG: sigma-70 family RNA polymerase sigma factor [Myxococcales bacterium]